MTNRQITENENDKVTSERREMTDKTTKDDRARNDETTKERRLDADKTLKDNRSRNDETTAVRREKNDGTQNRALAICLSVLLVVAIGSFFI